jgi:hypothetical protein
MGKVLGIVYRTLATHITARFHITKKAGYNKQTAQTGAVTLIQRFLCKKYQGIFRVVS